MSKKIKSIEELMKKIEECKGLIKIRKNEIK